MPFAEDEKNINHLVIHGTTATSVVDAASKLAASTFGNLDIQTQKENRNFFIVPNDFLKLTGYNGKIEKKITGEEFTVPWVPDEQDQPKKEASLSIKATCNGKSKMLKAVDFENICVKVA